MTEMFPTSVRLYAQIKTYAPAPYQVSTSYASTRGFMPSEMSLSSPLGMLPRVRIGSTPLQAWVIKVLNTLEIFNGTLSHNARQRRHSAYSISLASTCEVRAECF